MINLIKLILKILPWLLVVGLLSWMLITQKMESGSSEKTEIITNTLLKETEQMGKMELIKYRFQEVTEIRKIAQEIDLKLFKYKPVPDSKGVLISQGEAVGCIDLTKMSASDVRIEGDTVYITLPSPEICYFKIDLEKSRLYDLQTDYMRGEDRKKFIEELYRVAEKQIEIAAKDSGILEQTKESALVVLRPVLEKITGKAVVLNPGANLEGSPVGLEN